MVADNPSCNILYRLLIRLPHGQYLAIRSAATPLLPSILLHKLHL